MNVTTSGFYTIVAIAMIAISTPAPSESQVLNLVRSGISAQARVDAERDAARIAAVLATIPDNAPPMIDPDDPPKPDEDEPDIPAAIPAPTPVPTPAPAPTPAPMRQESVITAAGWCTVNSDKGKNSNNDDNDAQTGCDIGLGISLQRFKRLSWVAVLGSKTIGTGLAWRVGNLSGPVIAVAIGIVVAYDSSGIDATVIYPAVGATLSFASFARLGG